MERLAVLTVLALIAVSSTGCGKQEEQIVKIKEDSLIFEASPESIAVEQVNIVEPESEPEYYYYEVPQEFVMNGGEFPKELQEFTQDLCRERNLSYPMVLALIEKETGYRNITPNDCGSTGYMQVIQKWHQERMDKYGVTDLLDAKGNILVGTDYLEELFAKYHEINRVLMAYNMGESGAKALWDKGIYTSNYADYIIRRETEISEEIYGR